jgi:hypothetical protein
MTTFLSCNQQIIRFLTILGSKGLFKDVPKLAPKTCLYIGKTAREHGILGTLKITVKTLWNPFQGVAYVKKEGKIAYIGLKFFQETHNPALTLDLKIRDRGGYR